MADGSGNVYVTGGYTGTTDFDPNHTNPSSNHVLTVQNAGHQDAFVAKYLADGTFQWATDIGQDILPRRHVVVQGSNVYVGRGGNVSQLDAATGAVGWTTNFTGTGNTVNSYCPVAVGASGNLFASVNVSPGGVVAELDSMGNILWSRTSTGGTILSIGVDGVGNVYAAGTYSGTATFGTKSLTSSVSNGFIWKLNAGGDSLWAGSMGAGASASLRSMAVTSSGNVYATGLWSGSTGNFNPGSGGAVRLTNHGGDDVFIVKLVPGANGSLNASWGKDIGGSSNDDGYDLAVDAAGSVYTTGWFNGSVNFNPNSGSQHTLQASTQQAFVSKLDTNGNYADAAQLSGASSVSVGWAIGVDSAGGVHIGGNFTSTADFDPTHGTHNVTATGNDAFVWKLTQSGTSPMGLPPDSDGKGGEIGITLPVSSSTADTASPSAKTASSVLSGDSDSLFFSVPLESSQVPPSKANRESQDSLDSLLEVGLPIVIG
jgi:hypothetical protein